LETFDVQLAFLPLTIAKLSTLKYSLVYFGPPCIFCRVCCICNSYQGCTTCTVIKLVMMLAIVFTLKRNTITTLDTCLMAIFQHNQGMPFPEYLHSGFYWS